MGRILVLLTFAGLAAVFVIIYNARFESVQSAGTTTNSNVSSQGNSRGTKPAQLDKKRAASRRTSSRTSSWKENVYPSRVTANDKQGDAATPDREPADSSTEQLLTVKGESTPVYSANSKESKVLRVLRKGEKVRPDLEVIESGGRWRVVRGQQKDKPGFVRDEQIAPTSPKSPMR